MNLNLVDRVKDVFSRKAAAKRLTLQKAIIAAARNQDLDVEAVAVLLIETNTTAEQFAAEVEKCRRWLGAIADLRAEPAGEAERLKQTAELEKLREVARAWLESHNRKEEAVLAKLAAANAITQRAAEARSAVWDCAPPELIEAAKASQKAIHALVAEKIAMKKGLDHLDETLGREQRRAKESFELSARLAAGREADRLTSLRVERVAAIDAKKQEIAAAERAAREAEAALAKLPD